MHAPATAGNSGWKPRRLSVDGVVLLLCLCAAMAAYVAAAGMFVEGRRAINGTSYADRLDLRDAPLNAAAIVEEQRINLYSALTTLDASHKPERLTAPRAAAEQPGASGVANAAIAQPRIILIVDDAGLDPGMFEAFRALPGPLTFSFLPYAPNSQSLAEKAASDGDAVMLHLPMEPIGKADAGPNALTTRMSDTELKRALDWNLNQFSGFSGVNNHMGSRFTRNKKAMDIVMTRLHRQGLFFLDSVTTGGSVASRVGAEMGAPVFSRDVFLDAEPGREAVRAQLKVLEEIALEKGLAVAICHPRSDTLEVLGPWLTTAAARGFQLATVDLLVELDQRAREQRLAQIQ